MNNRTRIIRKIRKYKEINFDKDIERENIKINVDFLTNLEANYMKKDYEEYRKKELSKESVKRILNNSKLQSQILISYIIANYSNLILQAISSEEISKCKNRTSNKIYN